MRNLLPSKVIQMMPAIDVKIGLEIHAQLTTLKTKLFCGCSADYRRKPPNSSTCPVCLGLPGSLPVLNGKAVEFAVTAALALNCKVNERVLFFRKNYYYPDMPKNFQISQFDKAGGVPIAVDGFSDIRVDRDRKRINLSRVHLEEDPGKLVHLGPIDRSPYTLIDYNRAGIALLEIVTDPDLRSPKEARIFLQKLRSILEHLGILDGGLEGALRCDANVSIGGGTRVEVKNISSFKEVERALSFEIMRQKSLLDKEGKVRRETRHWDENRRVTITLRSKEEEQDYRYFPEPDLPPIVLEKNFIEELRGSMPELPDARIERFIKQYEIPRYDAEVLVGDKAMADFYEECVKLYGRPKDLSNWLMGDVLRYLYANDLEIYESKLTPKLLVEMLKLIDDGTISGKIAKELLPLMITKGEQPLKLVEARKLRRIASAEVIRELAEKIFQAYPEAVEDALSDPKAVNYLVGKLMKETRGTADPQLTNQIITEKLQEIKAKRGLE